MMHWPYIHWAWLTAAFILGAVLGVSWVWWWAGWLILQGDAREVLAGMEKNATRIHVVPDPDSDAWLVLHMTDQEAFEWDCEHYGRSVALDNWDVLQGDDPLRDMAGAEG